MIFDMNNFTKPSVSDSFLQRYSQLQCMSLSQNGEVLSYGSIDGRGNISKITKSMNGFTLVSELIFKVNKLESAGTSYYYPVNAIGFNIKNIKWLFTGSSDGVLQFWNYDGKSSIKTMNFKSVPVITAKTNYSGDLIAYALGNDWHIGPEGIGKWPTKIAVHLIPDPEVKFALKNK